MRKAIIRYKFIPISVVFLYFLCSNHTNKKESSTTEIKMDTAQTLISRANQFFKQKMYLESKLCYDSLILIDSTNGEYHFKRAFSAGALSYDDPNIDTDYLNAIKYNYAKKHAYFNLGIIHRFKAVFRCVTDKDKIAKYNTAAFFLTECLKIDPTNEQALKEVKEITNEINLIKQFPRQ